MLRAAGGQALMRLVQILESHGLGDVAEETIHQAVDAEAVPQVMDVAHTLGIAPTTEARVQPEERADSEGETYDGEAAPANGETEEGAVQPSAEAFAQAYIDAANELGPPTPTGPQWRSVGPWFVSNGQTYGASRVNVSGRISALAVDPRQPAHVLAGAANGGVWESRDRGVSWAPRTDYAATLTVGALAFDPNNTAIVYCGTGEGDWWSYLGAGILRSSDGGASWTTLCTNPFVGQGFYSLVVDPRDSRRLYAGTTGGLYVSTDSGVTWVRRRAVRTWSVSIVRGGTEVLGASSDGLFRSADNGTTWTRVALPGAPASFNRLAVAVAPSDPTVAYAWGAGAPFIGTNSLPTAYLFRRAGNTWTNIGAPPGAATGQAWYDWYVAAAPDRNDQVFCGAIDIHRGTLSGTAWTWVNLSSKTTAGSSSIHPDQHSIAFEPGVANTMYAGNDGGVYRSADRGITWVSCNNGLQVSEFEYIAANFGTSRWLIGGTQDNGTNRWTGPAVWEHVMDADGGDCGVNRANPQTVFGTWQWGRLWRSTTGGGFGSWTNITPTRPSGESPGLFYPPFECSATNGNTIALGGVALYVSRDLGGTWTRLAFPAAGTASAMFIPNADTVIVGLTDGRIYRTTFSSGVWSALTARTTPRAGAWISDLYAEGAGTGRMWATSTSTGGGRVFRSEDGGGTWTDCSAGLPALPITAVEVDTWNRNRVWVSADLGVYQSWNAGASWGAFSSSLPNAYVGDLAFHPHARVLRAGTRNRGVWEIPVDGWITNPLCGVQFTGTLAANASGRWFTFNWPATWHVIWMVMPTTVAPGNPQVSWVVEVERATPEMATYWLTVRNLTAQTITFEGRYAILGRY